MSTIKNIFLISFLTLLRFPIGAGDVLRWDFREESVQAGDWLESWNPVTEAARQPEAAAVQHPPGRVEGNHRALVITDVYDSSKNQQTDEAGTPVFRTTFEPVAAGVLRFRAGTSGTQNQNATLTLLAKGRPLMLLRLINNTEGMAVSRAGSKPFSDEESWFNRARDFEIAWTSTGDVSVVFTNAAGDTIDLDALGFLAPGRPDEIQLQVGFGRATGKALRLEFLLLESQP